VRRSEKWCLFQVCTANSTYHLEVQDPQEGGARRCAVLTCVAPSSRAGQVFEDSSPRAGQQSLYALTPLDWIGKSLEVGTARTSEVVSVEFLAANDAPTAARRSQTQVGSAPTTTVFPSTDTASRSPAERNEASRQEAPGWSAFPVSHVEMAEVAASLLNTICHRRDLLKALKAYPLPRKRLGLALDACRVLLESMEARTPKS